MYRPHVANAPSSTEQDHGPSRTTGSAFSVRVQARAGHRFSTNHQESSIVPITTQVSNYTFREGLLDE